MTKFCENCGAALRESAKFCGQCGHQSAATAATPPPSDRPAPTPSATVRPSRQTPPEDTDYPPVMGLVGDSPPPPQYWESYDYPSVDPKSPRDWIEKSEKGPFDPSSPTPAAAKFRPRDASRPLPKLSFTGPAAPVGAREKARDIARSFAISAAGIVLVPLPFSDLVFLMPVQTAMVLSIGKAYNVKDPPEKTLAHISAACGASVFGQITTLFVANLIPIIGKLVSAPFVYGWTYGLGEVAIRYFEAQGELQGDDLKKVFKQVSRDATRAFRRNEIKSVEDSFSHLKSHLSPEEYEKLRKRFS